MKKVIKLAMAAALVFGMASCSKEEVVVETSNETSNEVSTPGLQFRVSGGKSSGGITTYAAPESYYKENALYDLAVIALDGTKIIGNSAQGDFTVVTAGATAVVKATPEWLAANNTKTDVEFYFIGNNENAGSNPLFPSVWYENGKSIFAYDYSNDQFLHAYDDEFASLIEFHLGSGAVQPMFGSITGVNLTTGVVDKAITLKHLMARFDIYNDNATKVKVQDVQFKNVALNTPIFSSTIDWSYIYLHDIWGTNMSELDCVNFATASYDYSTKLLPGAFYLFPTILGSGQYDNSIGAYTSKIILNAKVDGVDRSFSHDSSGFQIEANKRYIIKLDTSSSSFTISVADFEEGEDISFM